MTANQTFSAIATTARVLGVSTAGYYAWRALQHPPSPMLLRRVRTIHAISHGTYGASRVHAEVHAEGRAVGKKRIVRLMRAAGIVGVSPPPWHRHHPEIATRGRRLTWWTATSPPIAPISSGLPTSGKSRRRPASCISLSCSTRSAPGSSAGRCRRICEPALVLAALEMAIGQRKPSDVIHHSDPGSQYIALALGGGCRKAGTRPSMGSVGDAHDYALCESFFATLECELLARL
jgi:putative transposase